MTHVPHTRNVNSNGSKGYIFVCALYPTSPQAQRIALAVERTKGYTKLHKISHRELFNFFFFSPRKSGQILIGTYFYPEDGDSSTNSRASARPACAGF